MQHHLLETTQNFILKQSVKAFAHEGSSGAVKRTSGSPVEWGGMAGASSGLAAKAGVLALGLVPPAVAGTKFWPAVTRHPLIALTLAVLYELSLLAASFAGTVFRDLQ
ncbi:hypothetical protein [Streptomyces sp. NPDC058249]|uniref:hypothetical protein n=1 Tax=Streptomyces sp. NPDC058249 TaxID=3346403 RepID=UPI0036ED486E